MSHKDGKLPSVIGNDEKGQGRKVNPEAKLLHDLLNTVGSENVEGLFKVTDIEFRKKKRVLQADHLLGKQVFKYLKDELAKEKALNEKALKELGDELLKERAVKVHTLKELKELREGRGASAKAGHPWRYGWGRRFWRPPRRRGGVGGEGGKGGGAGTDGEGGKGGIARASKFGRSGGQPIIEGCLANPDFKVVDLTEYGLDENICTSLTQDCYKNVGNLLEAIENDLKGEPLCLKTGQINQLSTGSNTTQTSATALYEVSSIVHNDTFDGLFTIKSEEEDEEKLPAEALEAPADRTVPSGRGGDSTARDETGEQRWLATHPDFAVDDDLGQTIITGRRSHAQFRVEAVVNADIEPLASSSRQKIPGTAIDAFGAWLYATKEKTNGPPDWCSSRHDEHIFAATREGTPESILARLRWIIPLCGGAPLHWILAWVDYAAKEIGIFDSIPELGSSSWGEPLFLPVLDVIREHIGAPKITWNSGEWKRRILSPSQLECQLDGWSCGVFVGMGIKAMADGNGEPEWAAVADSRKDEMRKFMLEAISSLPQSRFSWSTESLLVPKSKVLVAVVNEKESPVEPEPESGSSLADEFGSNLEGYEARREGGRAEQADAICGGDGVEVFGLAEMGFQALRTALRSHVFFPDTSFLSAGTYGKITSTQVDSSHLKSTWADSESSQV
ncbi:hypothetical protein B0H14DRAFT_2572445 [Mycena olivaceomarginata]|nr:hypothetical protein B0H14DRAFT_2572445 [Mycena olivaceomarginata]